VTTFPPPFVPVFPAGYGPQATDFGTWWANNAGFLQNRVVFRASQTTTATSLPDSGAVTTIGYDNVLEDPYSGWDSGTFLWTPPAGYSGWYQVTMTIRTVALSALVNLRASLAGSYTYQLTCLQGSSTDGGVSATYGVYLTGGQDSAGAAGQLLNSGSNVNTSLTAGQNSTLEICWLSQS
jgi:hypothetical protein